MCERLVKFSPKIGHGNVIPRDASDLRSEAKSTTNIVRREITKMKQIVGKAISIHFFGNFAASDANAIKRMNPSKVHTTVCSKGLPSRRGPTKFRQTERNSAYFRASQHNRVGGGGA
jgi:hypothetical protein